MALKDQWRNILLRPALDNYLPLPTTLTPQERKLKTVISFYLYFISSDLSPPPFIFIPSPFRKASFPQVPDSRSRSVTTK